jgi:hypothetical protein
MHVPVLIICFMQVVIQNSTVLFLNIGTCRNLLSFSSHTPFQMALILVDLYNNSTFKNKVIDSIPDYLNTPYIATIVTALQAHHVQIILQELRSLRINPHSNHPDILLLT